MSFMPINKFDNCYSVHALAQTPLVNVALPTVYVADYKTWHQHVGHMSEYAFQHLPVLQSYMISW